MNRKTQVLCMICMTILMLFLGATYVEGYKTARSYMRTLNVEGMKFSDNDYMSGIDENISDGGKITIRFPVGQSM